MISLSAFLNILHDTNYVLIKLILEHMGSLSQSILDKCLERIISADKVVCLELFMMYDIDHVPLPADIFTNNYCGTYKIEC